MVNAVDWYERRDELEPGQVFKTIYVGLVQLDRRVAGDGTRWFVLTWIAGRPGIPGYERGHWSCEDDTIEPCDLAEMIPAGEVVQ